MNPLDILSDDRTLPIPEETKKVMKPSKMSMTCDAMRYMEQTRGAKSIDEPKEER